MGFSWAYDPKTVLRGGFGLYSYTWSLDTYGGNNTSYGMGAAISSSGSDSDQTNGVIPVTKLDGNGSVCTPLVSGGCVPSTTPLPYTQASTDPTAYNGQGVGYVQYHTPVPRIMQWNLSVQRALTTDFVAEVAYVGSHASNLNFPTDLNQVPLADLSSNDSGSRPYPIFQGISGSTNNAHLELQLAAIVRHQAHAARLEHAVQLCLGAYAGRSGFLGMGQPLRVRRTYQIANNPAANYANSNFDVRHAFKGYAVYELPFGKGKPFLNGNQLLDEAVGGWQLAGTVILQTGQSLRRVSEIRTLTRRQALSSPTGVPGVSPHAQDQARNNWFNVSGFLSAG